MNNNIWNIYAIGQRSPASCTRHAQDSCAFSVAYTHFSEQKLNENFRIDGWLSWVYGNLFLNLNFCYNKKVKEPESRVFPVWFYYVTLRWHWIYEKNKLNSIKYFHRGIYLRTVLFAKSRIPIYTGKHGCEYHIISNFLPRKWS